MLSLFDTSKPILFFPARWANSVTRWLTGLYSPDGTIDIANTPDPSDNGGCGISINADAVYQLLKTRMAQDFVLKNELASEVAEKSDSTIATKGTSLHVEKNALGIAEGGSSSTVNGYTGTVTGVPYGSGSATQTMYFKNGLRYTSSALSSLYGSSQTLGGSMAYFTSGKLRQYGTTDVSASSISIACGSFTFYWNAGYLKSVNGSPY